MEGSWSKELPVVWAGGNEGYVWAKSPRRNLGRLANNTKPHVSG